MSLFETLGLFIDGAKDIVKNYEDMNNSIKNDFQEIFFDKPSYEKPKRSDTAQYGDVICVQKPGYYHFGIYISDKKIVHFAPQSEFDSITEAMEDAVIHKTTLRKFLGDGCNLFVCDFEKDYAEPSKRSVKYVLPGESFFPDVVRDTREMELRIKKLQYKVYSPSETVERALSKIGQTKYNLALNNCEHFAIWCKTGIKESHQVNKILDIISPIQIPVCT